MTPSQLQPVSFSAYPPAARELAVENIALLRRMPLAFLPLLLREVIAFDWKFPAERLELLDQFKFVAKLPPTEFDREMAPFAAIRLNSDLEDSNWVNEPAEFSERLSAHLWATHQIEAFRTASVAYVDRLNRSRESQKPDGSRLTLVNLGPGEAPKNYLLLQKLRRQGAFFSNVDGADGKAAVVEVLRRRSAKYAAPYSHWFIDGSESEPLDGVACLSYGRLQAVRERLVARMRQVMAPGGAGPEALRSLMARMTPQDLGLVRPGGDGVLDRFQISVLTEGSGTQLFSTTFVQWAAREVLRRAQPLTVILNYAPRQREQSMQEQLSGKPHSVELDIAGSLIDADMGAYYTWLNSRRLPAAEDDHFIAWFESKREAVVVGPGFEKGRESHDAATLKKLLERTGNL